MNTAKSIIVGCLVGISLNCFCLLPIHAQENPDAIIGLWETEEKDAKIKVYKEGEAYHAKLLWGDQVVHADGSSKKDVNNPDRSKKNRELVGSVMIKGLTFEGEEWKGGRVYNNANGKWYKCYVWLVDEQLFLRGYLGLPIMGQTTKWNRIQQ